MTLQHQRRHHGVASDRLPPQLATPVSSHEAPWRWPHNRCSHTPHGHHVPRRRAASPRRTLPKTDNPDCVVCDRPLTPPRPSPQAQCDEQSLLPAQAGVFSRQTYDAAALPLSQPAFPLSPTHLPHRGAATVCTYRRSCFHTALSSSAVSLLRAQQGPCLRSRCGTACGNRLSRLSRLHRSCGKS